MRLHPLAIVLSIPALFLACSDGGLGTAPSPGGSSAFGQPGANLPALSPITPTGGGQTPEVPPADTGTTQDTNPVDTGTPVQDTSSDECSTLLASTCSADGAPSATQLSTCRTQLMGTCSSEWRALYQCVQTSRVCDSTTMATDWTATLTACQTQQDAATACGGGA